MPDFDDDKYQDSLKFIADKAFAEYHFLSMDHVKHQSSLLKTYLWLSSLTCAFQTSLYYKVLASEISTKVFSGHPDFWFHLFGLISIALSLGAFVLGSDTLRGRGESHFPISNFEELSDIAYNMASKPRSQILYPSMIKNLNAEINRQIKSTNLRGKKLRIMSRLIISSILFSVLATIALAVQNLP